MVSRDSRASKIMRMEVTATYLGVDLEQPLVRPIWNVFVIFFVNHRLQVSSLEVGVDSFKVCIIVLLIFFEVLRPEKYLLSLQVYHFRIYRRNIVLRLLRHGDLIFEG
jgi:hypothetical protein